MHTMYCESKSELNLKAYTYTIVFSCTMTMNVSWKVLSLLTSLLCSLSLTVAVNQAYSELVLLNNCICAGHEVIYQCTVCGQGATEWTGSLFDCAGNTITLRHNQFWSGIGGECNNGAVIARRIGTTIINCSLCFISQLSFSASYDKNNKTILCLYVDGTSENIVDTTTMVITTEPYPPPNDIHISSVGQNYLTFTWNRTHPKQSLQESSCSDIVYNINATNCGVCPNSTTSTSTTCTNIIAQDSLCFLAIQTSVCGNIVGQESDVVTTLLQVPEAPTIEAQLFSSLTSSTLIYVTLHINTLNISDDIGASAINSSTVTYSDTTTGSVCGMINIPVPSELCLDWTCRHAFEVSLSSCLSSSDFTISAFATNIFGNGPMSSPVYIKKVTLQPQCESNYNGTDIQKDENVGLCLAASAGSAALLLSCVVFITITVILVQHVKFKRESGQARAIHQPTVEYEEISLNRQDSAIVHTEDNVAYNRVSMDIN